MRTPPLPTVLSVALSVGLSLPSEATAQEPQIPTHYLYVCIQDDASVAIVDMDRVELVRIIRLTELGFDPRAAPHDVAVARDGRHWYVSLVGEHRVLQFDAGDRLVGSAEMESPGMLALDPSGERLMISRSMSATNPPRLLGLAEPSDMRLEELDVLFQRPHAVAIGAGGRFGYSASLAVNQLVAVELSSGAIEVTDVAGPPQAFVQLAVSPDGLTLVVTGEISGELTVFSLEDPAHPRLVTSVSLGPRPFDPVFAPDGRTVWIPIKGSDEIAVVETEGWTVVDRVRGTEISQPHAIEFSPDGLRAFVTNNRAGAGGRFADPPETATGLARLVAIDVLARRIESSLELGHNLAGLSHRGAR
jgi:DNA-binding beta-propeller fold protein YncE